MSKSNQTHTEIINAHLRSLVPDEKALKKLLYLEKERRQVSKDELVFLGMAGVADYFWCAMKSLYKSRQNEPGFFGSYLYDRIDYSLRLGLIDKLPKSHPKLLEIGNNIGFSDIERLLKERAEKTDKQGIELAGIEITYKDGSRLGYSGEGEEVFWYCAANGTRSNGLEKTPPIERGKILHMAKAEDYPTIRWNYTWDKYVIVGVPDGITDEFVYEFKSTTDRFLAYFVRYVAFTQGDLYGYFFRRSKKRVQIYILKEDVTETWDSDVDENRVQEVLTMFKKTEEGFAPPPPKAWKCKSCDFGKVCTTKAS